jgi:aldose 1-epimerase
MEITLEAEDARVIIDVASGARIASLQVEDMELLVAKKDDPFMWGCFAMVPWAGRVRNGVFSYGGITHQLPISMPPHAIHGTTYDREWIDEGDGGFSIELGDDWPFPGRVHQRVRLYRDALELQLEVEAVNESFPACIGWHPWFQRRLSRGYTAEIDFKPTLMYARDSEGIPDGNQVMPIESPWDDCFTGLKSPPIITWPDALQLEFESTASHWVVYDEPEHALCIEPQTGPPNAFNLIPEIVTPGRSLILDARLCWELL